MPGNILATEELEFACNCRRYVEEDRSKESIHFRLSARGSQCAPHLLYRSRRRSESVHQVKTIIRYFVKDTLILFNDNTHN